MYVRKCATSNAFGIEAERSQLMNKCAADACCLANCKLMKRKRTDKNYNDLF